MTVFEAQEIVHQFGAVLERETGPFRRMSLLPRSKDDIKSAYRIFIRELIFEQGPLSEDDKNVLTHSYGMIDSFFLDGDAKKLTDIYSEYKRDHDLFSRTEYKETQKWFLESLAKNIPNIESKLDLGEFIDGVELEKRLLVNTDYEANQPPSLVASRERSWERERVPVNRNTVLVCIFLCAMFVLSVVALSAISRINLG